MQVYVNGSPVEAKEGETLTALQKRLHPSAQVRIINGYQTDADLTLSESDRITLIEKGVLPPPEELEEMMMARHSPKVHEKMKNACVGVAGLGGLGSAIAVLLARTGVGKLVLADFDTVEPSNLNRQNYFVRHLGLPKTEAMAAQLREINPYTIVETHMVRISEVNAGSVFSGCQIVCEAFDRPEEKSMLVGTLLDRLPEVKVVAGSGMAGFGSANTIRTEKRLENLYLCGDGETEAREGVGLMAPRVMVCAAHQANMALRLILGMTEA